MDNAELILRFTGPDQVSVSYAGTDSGPLAFTNPIVEKDRSDIRWYVEIYGAHSLADPDDAEARRIERRLGEIGKSLFQAVFQAGGAQEPYLEFRNSQAGQRVVTITSNDSSILSLPWELLNDPRGVFLFRERPHISVRRRVAGAEMGRRPFQIEQKQHLHLLFVVSRPQDVSFIDPRSDPQAVLDALEEHAPGRVTCEFLRPATLNALVARLDDESKPSVDILHFDGHGIFMNVAEGDDKKVVGIAGKTIQNLLLRERQFRGDEATGKSVGAGFLVFEKEDGTKHLVSAEDFGENLFRSQVGLVVLSACQTASLDVQSDPMASVAGNLTRTGIPAILAMTHSVLVATTKVLFGEFYGSLAKGRGLATSLDDARTYLANNPAKFEVQRGDRRQMLELKDWFVPALFHAGEDKPLLKASGKPAVVSSEKHNLRSRRESGFFGRRRELWEIERWFGAGETRRISVTGFGGQGKTELALEAGRWLLRTGMFQQAVFVDYAAVQSRDAVSAAVSTISVVLEESFPDAAAVTRALEVTPTLVILDNLESLEPESLQELLTAAAAWSQAGDSRVLLTSRQPETGHPDFAIQGTFLHRRIRLDGLGSAAQPDDALDWFAQLDRLPSAELRQAPPPKRDELVRLFDRVQFHPLSIRVLAQQLKTRTAGQLEKRLEQLLGGAASLSADEGTPETLIASLELSLERLTEKERHAVRRLGVFQGGAFEDDLLAITGLGTSDQKREALKTLLSALDGGDPRVLLRTMGLNLPDDAEIPGELLAQLTDNPEFQLHAEQLRAQLAALPKAAADDIWPALRRSLEAAALVEAELVPSVGPPFLRFHPTLAPMLWAGLDASERDSLTLAYRQRYYLVARYLYHKDSENPHHTRGIARRELPNLLNAVHGALEASDADAVEFAVVVARFLKVLGMPREAVLLASCAEQAGGLRGSPAWYLTQSNRAEHLLNSGRANEAANIFADILETLGDQPSYNRSHTLTQLGRSYYFSGRPDLAEASHRRSIEVAEQLEQTDIVKRNYGVLRADLADDLMNQGKYAEAREQYELGLLAAKELNDLRTQGVILGQLGTLAMREGDLSEAARCFRQTLELSQSLGEPEMEAISFHQLGVLFQKAQQWEQAERHYRESARLEEQRGNLAGAAQTWNQLGIVNNIAGKRDAAETWFRKALDGGRKTGDAFSTAGILNNLADLLQTQPYRLDEARQLAEEALVVKLTMDSSAAQIWTTYEILASIANQQSQPREAAEYHRLARETKRNFAGNSREIRRHLPVIVRTLQALQLPDSVNEFRAALSKMNENGWGKLTAAINLMLAGERDPAVLCDPLDLEDSMIIETILAAIADPTTLANFLPSDAAAE